LFQVDAVCMAVSREAADLRLGFDCHCASSVDTLKTYKANTSDYYVNTHDLATELYEFIMLKGR